MKNTFQKFLDIYLKNGFQSLSKKDIDLLIFYFMEQDELIEGNTNYYKSRFLRITPNKLATLQLESYMRWGDENRGEILREFFRKTFEEKRLNKTIEEQRDIIKKGKIPLTIENSVERLQLERTLKEINSNIEYTLNKEVIVVDVKTLFEIVYFSIDNKEKIKQLLNNIEELDVYEYLTKKDFRNITFDEYRKLLNQIGFEGIKEIGKGILSKIVEALVWKI